MILTITLPSAQNLLIKKGQDVDFTTPLYSEQAGSTIKIAIAKRLSIPPHKIFQHLKKFVGDTVKKNDVLAEKKSLFSTRKYKSEFEGIIKEIDHGEGMLLLEAETDVRVVHTCYFKGEVVDVEKNLIHLKVAKAKEYPLKDITRDFGGEVIYPGQVHSVVEEEISGKIVCVNHIRSFDQAKLETLGAAGFVTIRALAEETDLPACKIKDVADFEAAFKAEYPACVGDKKNSKIYFYQ